MKIQRPLSRKVKFALLALVPVYFIAAGIVLQPFHEIGPGLSAIIREPDFLITDYILIGGVGAAFINAGILCLISIGVVYLLGMEMDGHTITSAFLMFGFSLFGKNLVNIWLILLGVVLYAWYHKTCVSRYIYIGFYGTSLSPLITQMMQISLPLMFKVLLCIFTGVLIGFLLPPLCTHVHFAHQGYSLYNVGFAGGIIATVIVSMFRSFGMEVESRLIWSTGNNRMFVLLLGILFGGLILLGVGMDGKTVFERYIRIIKSTGIAGTDYLISEGAAAVLVNMGLNGLVVTAFLVLIGGDLNGPTIGSIFTVVGFSSTGKHLRNILPVMSGVLIASLIMRWNITDPAATLALLLSTTLAPVAGRFGIGAGILAGFLHSSVALNVGIMHGGMNLYNNGFAGGLVAIFLVPVIQSFIDRKARARGGLSL